MEEGNINLKPEAALLGVRSPPFTRPGEVADGAIAGQRLRNPLTQTQPSLHHFGFNKAGESTASSATQKYSQGNYQRGTSVPQADPNFSTYSTGQRKEINNEFANFSFVTYNVEHLSQERMENIIQQTTKHNLTCVILIGTRSTYSQDKLYSNYTAFYMPAGNKGHLYFTGITILIKNLILQKAKVNKIPPYSTQSTCYKN